MEKPEEIFWNYGSWIDGEGKAVHPISIGPSKRLEYEVGSNEYGRENRINQQLSYLKKGDRNYEQVNCFAESDDTIFNSQNGWVKSAISFYKKA